MGMVRYTQSPPCTIFSHTHKTAEEKDNHTQTPPNGSRVTNSSSSVKVKFHVPSPGQDKGWVCISSRQREHKGLHYSWMDRSTSLQCDWCASAQTPLTNVALTQPWGLIVSAEVGLDPSPSISNWQSFCSLSLLDSWLLQHLAPSLWPLSRTIPALLLVHTDTATQGTPSSWPDTKVQGP